MSKRNSKKDKRRKKRQKEISKTLNLLISQRTKNIQKMED